MSSEVTPRVTEEYAPRSGSVPRSPIANQCVRPTYQGGYAQRTPSVGFFILGLRGWAVIGLMDLGHDWTLWMEYCGPINYIGPGV